jgi:metal-responsive CopG/Arc/MetJ family transcriptional regulator
MSEINFEDLKLEKTKAKRASYSINETVLENFNKIAQENKYNKSRIIENFLRQFVELETKLI